MATKKPAKKTGAAKAPKPLGPVRLLGWTRCDGQWIAVTRCYDPEPGEPVILDFYSLRELPRQVRAEAERQLMWFETDIPADRRASLI